MLQYTDAQAAEGLLKTDIALIDADNTYAVFSIRVRRDFIANNHNILNVLSDLAGDCGSVPKSKPRPKNNIAKLTLALTFVAGIMVPSPIFNSIHHAMAQSTPPIDVNDIRMLTPTASVGGELIISGMVHRTRTCPTQVYRSIIRDSDGAVVDQMMVPAEMIDITPEPVPLRVAIHLARHIQPGKYHYHARLISTCDGEVFVTAQRNMPFEIIPADWAP